VVKPLHNSINRKSDSLPLAAFGFLLSFYTNPWIAEKGYSLAFGQMAAISGTVIVFVFYFWGKPIRHYTWNWKIMKRYGHWDADREVGE
jgi:hypothetical protein